MKSFVFVLSLLILLPTANAAEALTWSECLGLAARSNDELKSAVATERATQLQEDVARGAFFPSLSGSLSYTRGNSPSLEAGGSANYSASLSASQSLFSGFQDAGKLAQAQANTRAAEQTLRLTKARVGYDLQNAFEALVIAQASSKLAGDILDRRRENLRIVELRYQSGLENKGSLLLSQAYLSQANYGVLKAQDQIRVARADLARALGVDDPAALNVKGDVPLSEPSAVAPDFKTLASLTPQYLQSVAQSEAAGAGVRVARSGFYPTLGLSGSFGKVGSDFFPDRTDRWSVGATLTIPLFNGGKDYFGAQAAVASLTAADATRFNTARVVASSLEQAHATYAESAAKLKSDADFRAAAQVRAEIARRKYNNGLLSFDDWDVIENDLITREQTYLQSRRDRATAEAAWRQTLGETVIP